MYEVSVTKTGLKDSQLVSVGSLMEAVPPDYSGTIIGTGYMDSRSAGNYPKANILAVRGALTAERCGAVNAALGDPGLMVKGTVTVTGEYGPAVIPHYIDDDLQQKYPDYHFVNVLTDPADFVTEVSKCSAVVTSSLHALITADALGLPRMLVPHHKVGGGLFKFQDYASSLGTDIQPGVMSAVSTSAVDQCVSRLKECYEEFVCDLG
jgi:hypothetical protein